LQNADAAIVVIDGSMPLTDEDRFCLAAVENCKSLIAVNKNDLKQRLDIDQLKRLVDTRGILSISTKSGDGLRTLETSLRDLLLGTEREPEIVLTNVRHKAALLRGEEALASAALSLRDNSPPECVAVELNDARDALEEIIGAVKNDEILERIFTNFCIGK
jgi:tRNA modification GTPase